MARQLLCWSSWWRWQKQAWITAGKKTFKKHWVRATSRRSWWRSMVASLLQSWTQECRALLFEPVPQLLAHFRVGASLCNSLSSSCIIKRMLDYGSTSRRRWIVRGSAFNLVVVEKVCEQILQKMVVCAWRARWRIGGISWSNLITIRLTWASLRSARNLFDRHGS